MDDEHGTYVIQYRNKCKRCQAVYYFKQQVFQVHEALSIPSSLIILLLQCFWMVCEQTGCVCCDSIVGEPSLHAEPFEWYYYGMKKLINFTWIIIIIMWQALVMLGENFLPSKKINNCPMFARNKVWKF